MTDRTVRRWINGTIRPDYDKLLQIEALSGGLVTPRDIIEHPSPKRGPGRPKLARLAIARV